MVKWTKWLVTFLIFVFVVDIVGQTHSKSVTVKHLDEAIILDGVMDESVWQIADVAGDFQQFFPSDQVKAEYPTEVKVLFSDTHLYIGIYAVKEPGNYVVSTLRRDFGATTNDNISLLFELSVPFGLEILIDLLW